MHRVLRVGLGEAPLHFDPRRASEALSQAILGQIFEHPFIASSAASQPSPWLFAEPLRAADHSGRHWSAAVQPGARFPDGTELTAETLAHALEVSRIVPGSVRAEHPNRVVFDLDQPVAHLEALLAQPQLMVYRETDGGLLGTGPYRFAADNRPDRVHLLANPYWRRPVGVEEVVLEVMPPDPDGVPRRLLAALAAGELDLASFPSREHVEGLTGLRKWLDPGSSVALLYFNLDRPALASLALRRAFAHALDRGALTRHFFVSPEAFTATGLLPPLLGLARDGIRHDLAAARAALATLAEVPRHLSLVTIFRPRPYLPDPNRMAVEIARQIAELGITLEVVVTTPESYFDRVAHGDYDLLLSGWISDTPHAQDFLETLLAPGAIPIAGREILSEGNLARWRDPDVAAALVAYRNDPSLVNRGRILERVREEIPLLPLMYGPTTYAYSDRVKRFRPSPLGLPEFADIELA